MNILMFKMLLMKNKAMKLEEKIVHSILSCTLALHYTEQLKHTKFYVQKRKNLLNQILFELKKEEHLFNNLESVVSQQLIDIYNNFYDFINIAGKINIEESGEITAIIEAYKKDKKSMLGITKKILKQGS